MIADGLARSGETVNVVALAVSTSHRPSLSPLVAGSSQPQLLATQYGYSLMKVDSAKVLMKGPAIFESLDHAFDDIRWLNWTWVFFDAKAVDKLSKFVHQQDKIVYVFGDDVAGWGRPLNQLPGALVHIDTGMPLGTEHTADLCAEAVIVHRFYQVDA